jgi:hypothetical protein
LHPSFELKQRVNGFQPILDNGPQLFPAAFAGVYDLPQRNRLAGQIGRDGLAKEPITVEDANFAHVPRIEANRDLFTDISCERIQAHLYGQQHDVLKRDAVLEHIQKLHDGGKPAPQIVIIENDPLPDGGAVRICDYVEPQSRFHIVLMAEYYDASGRRVRRTALESDDIDQVAFRKEHPDQAAAVVRVYSMDGYSANVPT